MCNFNTAMSYLRYLAMIFIALECTIISARSNAVYQGTSEASKVSRLKRSLNNAYDMVRCAIDNADPWDYVEYGCWCGVGGKGEPIDEIDSCCKLHDECYDSSSCLKLFYYITTYDFKCIDKDIRCDNSNKTKCKEQLCQCDKEWVKCLANYKYPKKKPACDN